MSSGGCRSTNTFINAGVLQGTVLSTLYILFYSLAFSTNNRWRYSRFYCESSLVIVLQIHGKPTCCMLPMSWRWRLHTNPVKVERELHDCWNIISIPHLKKAKYLGVSWSGSYICTSYEWHKTSCTPQGIFFVYHTSLLESKLWNKSSYSNTHVNLCVPVLSHAA